MHIGKYAIYNMFFLGLPIPRAQELMLIEIGVIIGMTGDHQMMAVLVSIWAVRHFLKLKIGM